MLLTINGWAGKSPVLDGLMVVSAAWLIYAVFAAALCCLAFYAYRRQWRPIAYFAATLIVTFVVLKMMEILNLDHRPFMDHSLTQLIGHEPGQSFPSDHTTSSVAVALGVLAFTKFKKLGAALLGAALLIGFSRVFVGVHYPADIAGGILTASIGCGIVLISSHFIERRQADDQPSLQE